MVRAQHPFPVPQHDERVSNRKRSGPKSSLITAGPGAAVVTITNAVFFLGKTVPPAFLIIGFFSEFIN